MSLVTSTIKKVSIFSDRAQVSRHAPITITAGGEQTFIFADLPKDMDRKLLQVQCLKGATTELILQSVEHTTVHSATDNNPEIEALRTRIQEYNDNLTDLSDQIEILDIELKSYEKIVSRVSHPVQEASEERFDVGAWDRVLQYAWKGQQEGIAKKRVIERQRAALQKELSVLNSRLSSLGSGNSVTSTERVEVTVLAKGPGKATLVINYVIPNASWRPLYDVRVDTVKRSIVVSYHGIITQRTSENWEDVEVELSTASPNIGGNAPELEPWRVSKSYYNAFAKSAAPRRSAPMMQQMMNAYVPEMDMAMESLCEDATLSVASAAVNTKATSVFFSIAGLQNVKSDGSESKVTVFQQEFPAHFRYSCVPKLTTHAYLKAKAINATECPMLPGDVNVFLDNNFVSTSKMDLVPPGTDFWVFLGVDDSVAVSHKLLNKKSTQEGNILSGKKVRITYTYLITVKNSKKTTEEVVVWDQIPIAEDGKITVEITEAYAMGTDNMKVNEVKFVEWFLNLTSGQEQKIPFTFYVEYPAGESVSGLE
eukprot:PhF_6_TR42108/c0_g1_i1/m.63578